MVAAEAAEQIVPAPNPHGFNFAFLDPFGLEGLPFSIIQTFARFKRMDVLIYSAPRACRGICLAGWSTQRGIVRQTISRRIGSYLRGGEQPLHAGDVVDAHVLHGSIPVSRANTHHMGKPPPKPRSPSFYEPRRT